MKMFLMVVGLMACCWIIQDALHPVSKKLDADTPLNKVLGYPLAFFIMICTTISFPIVLFITWHDRRMEKIYKQIFLDDHQKHIDKLNGIIDRLQPPKAKAANHDIVYFFERTINKCFQILSNANFKSLDISLDLIALIYTICDFSVSNSKIRDSISSRLSLHISKNYIPNRGKAHSMLDKRITFYGEVIRGRKLHAHCMPIDISSALPHVCCAIALCDRLVYPTYFSNYDAPEPTLDALTTFEITMDVLEPLVEELKTLYEDVSAIANRSPKDLAKSCPNGSGQPTKAAPTVEPSSAPVNEEYYYMEAANGMTVRVPASRLEAWEAEQDKIRRGEAPELTDSEKRSIDRIINRIYGSQEQ